MKRNLEHVNVSGKVLIQHCIRILDEWCERSGLKVKPEKTQLLHFSGKQIDLDLEINDVRISNLSETKYLGIYLDKKLNFNFHVKQLAAKANTILHALRAIFRKNSNFTI